MKIIVPMAGLGTRFQKVAHLNEEYRKPKPFIMVHDHPMVRWATGSLPFVQHPGDEPKEYHWVKPADLIFIILKSHDTEYKIEKGLRDIYSNEINVVILPEVTRGAAETAYQAKSFVSDDEDVLITDSDHHFNGIPLMKLIIEQHPETAGIIPVFRARNEGIPKWSYSLMKQGSNFVEKVAEKDRALMEAGAFANIGAYYFSKAKHFFSEAADVIKNNRRSGDPQKGEFYIAPLYQNLIEKGHKIQAVEIPEVWGLGTPDDLDYFLKSGTIRSPHF